MGTLLKIALYVLLPLVWGVGVEYAFARLRRWRYRRAMMRKDTPCT
ncbi:MAG: hypothetical protein KGY99_03100 [Phycisphaerae bacterium]|nr:hypothetical protein [Phycisphaerae bacterium]